MPKLNSTSILVLLDRSGSMAALRDDTIGGFNTFVAEQKKLPGECRLSLVQFDTEGMDTFYLDRPIGEIPNLTAETFVPRGGTPLLDAMGKTINNLGDRLAHLLESQRPNQVIFVIITDGEENSSREFTKGRVFSMVQHQKDKYGWLFMYLGANQDAIQEASGYGIGGTFAMSYNAGNSAAVNDTYRVASNAVGRMRSSGASGQSLYASPAVMDSLGFNTAERAEANASDVDADDAARKANTP